MSEENKRLDQQYTDQKEWLKWGPYLSERQWGTVREDYSKDGNAWDYFPHDHARSRVYRWGEDGIAGISDDNCRICFSMAMWNGKDSIIKERLFGLTGPQGNHAEDVKELYYYLDNTPTHSYMKYLYKYTQNPFPYEELEKVNAHRTVEEYEYEILDTGVFDNNQYFDVYIEYGKEGPEDIAIKITVNNRNTEAAELYLLPTLWFRNLWMFNQMQPNNVISRLGGRRDIVNIHHSELGKYELEFEEPQYLMFTNNENNAERLFGIENQTNKVKDRFHKILTQELWHEAEKFTDGSKFSPLYHMKLEGGGEKSICLRFKKKIEDQGSSEKFDRQFVDDLMAKRKKEADDFYEGIYGAKDEDLRNIQRQAWAGMLWTKQYYNYSISQWLKGDPGSLSPPKERLSGRNIHWQTLYNEDIISMPDKWEYPWYAAWDLAFHCITLAQLDIEFAKDQLLLMVGESYMHPNGQIPAYEWQFSDVNPPVHGWATMEVFRMEASKTGKKDINFLKRIFAKLSLNFNWWVNRKDRKQNNIFEGGFLGLDNIGIFDRNVEIPGGGYLQQADSTAWMAMFALNMLDMAMEIAIEDEAFEDMTIKYFEHFIYISEALNRIDDEWAGIWNNEDGFFYDVMVKPENRFIPVKIRSIVGLTTLFAVLKIDHNKLAQLKSLSKWIKNFFKYRRKTGKYMVLEHYGGNKDLFLTLIPRSRLHRVIKTMIDSNEFFSEFGIRSLSKVHSHPFYMKIAGMDYSIAYDPGESTSKIYGGNSNWRGPIWMPINYLIIQKLQQYYYFFCDDFLIEDPNNPGEEFNLKEIAQRISANLISIFQHDKNKFRPVNRKYEKFYSRPENSDLILFFEYFQGDNGRGVGASHQTGWTGLVANLIQQMPEDLLLEAKNKNADIETLEAEKIN
ncbi:MGH1-like glycoside hydrolase domain-containing protein [Membranihabitans marinus]|uniref:MGH1-like glycoside hydrolase domain-containing protein n=1 Tax=Membranihabitans marinus TaxID=1227546 RepID=UPI001F2C8D83|nr:glucosidase [Membranihabitans marinus]